jgi:dephospho-CoA kinase
MSKRILIIGHAQHGKDTVAEILRDDYGVKFASSSRFAIEKAVWPMVDGKGPWISPEQLYTDRANHREMLFHAIRAYNLIPGPSLAEQMFREGYDCYVGMRSADEYMESRGSFQHVIWVSAQGRKPLEPETSMELQPYMADHILDNNQDLDHLRKEVWWLAENVLDLVKV